MSDIQPLASPVVKAGLLALTLDEAMQRLHSSHRSPHAWDFNWRACRTSTLCGGASQLLDDCELEIAAARVERGEA